MPATGPCAPARTFVAVRAMVPVTQMPPKNDDATLATPWATSSQLERCLRPVMPSATTADNKDSMDPSRANESAAGSTACALANVNSGRAGIGMPDGMPPNRVPIVSTGKWSTPTSPADSHLGRNANVPLRDSRIGATSTRLGRTA